MGSIYKVNTVDSRKRSSRIIAKRIELRKQINNNIPLKEKLAILKKIQKLGTEMDKIEAEIKKTQQGEQNSDRWMDGNNNSFYV